MDFGNNGYLAFKKILKENIQPKDIIDEIKLSGLRGRGGAGFPTGNKWEFVANEVSDEKFIVCNGDEGDPGAFMDRAILEESPNAVLEAMRIAGYTVGAKQGFVYVRAEYPTAVKNLQAAIDKAREQGFLGEDFDVTIRLGAGAFVCGEETALLNSIEGKRGEPNPKPPYPSSRGLYGKPTLINNVETFANIPNIILHGAKNFKNTKVFAVSGAVKKGGLIEVPLGTTINELVNNVCGGANEGRTIKAIQIGGPSGGCIPVSMFDTPLDYDTIGRTGAMLGSGGIVVLDDTTCIVEFSKFFIKFSQEESCGKCTPCRIGNRKLMEILEKITAGKATKQDVIKMRMLSQTIMDSSLCGLGHSSPTPVLSALQNFEQEFMAHLEGKCPAGVCFSKIEITDKCVGCGLCSRKCPVNAISGQPKTKYVIDQTKCVKCEVCVKSCPVHAIIGGKR